MKKIIFLIGFLTIISSCNTPTKTENTNNNDEEKPTSSEFQFPENHLAELGGECPCSYCSGKINIKDDYLLDLL